MENKNTTGEKLIKPIMGPSLCIANQYFIFRDNGQEIKVLLIGGCIVSDALLLDSERDYLENHFNLTYQPLWKFPESI